MIIKTVSSKINIKRICFFALLSCVLVMGVFSMDVYAKKSEAIRPETVTVKYADEEIELSFNKKQNNWQIENPLPEGTGEFIVKYSVDGKEQEIKVKDNAKRIIFDVNGNECQVVLTGLIIDKIKVPVTNTVINLDTVQNIPNLSAAVYNTAYFDKKGKQVGIEPTIQLASNGIYTLKGSFEGSIYVDNSLAVLKEKGGYKAETPEEKELLNNPLMITLDNAVIESKYGKAIEVVSDNTSSDNVGLSIFLADGSHNLISGMLSASCNIFLNGNDGKLDIADTNVALYTGQSVFVYGGNYSLHSKDKGMYVEHTFILKNGTVDVKAKNEGIDCGQANLEGGELKIDAGKKKNAVTGALKIGKGVKHNL